MCWIFALYHEGILRRIGLLTTEVLDLVFILFTQVVKPKTVSFRIHYLTQCMLKAAALCSIKQTLKNRILNPLAIIDALLGNLPQSSAPCRIFSIHIICNQHKHIIPHFHRNGG